MQQIIIITPVAEPHLLAALFKSLQHDSPVLVHWFVVFDCTQARYYETWQKVFSFHQEHNINIHCILSDKYRDKYGLKNINVAFDILENHVLPTDPKKAECWVYQLTGNAELHPSFVAYLHQNEFALLKSDMIFFNDSFPPGILLSINNVGSFCFRLRLLNFLRYNNNYVISFINKLQASCKRDVTFSSVSYPNRPIVV